MSDCATAYEIKSTIYKNAEKHADNEYFLKIDLENFFPSITYKNFLDFLTENNDCYSNEYLLSKKDKIILKNCLFDENSRLPQGFCTSPKIINIMMLSFDNKVLEILGKYTEFNTIYTRYSDDIIVSCKKKGLSYLIFKEINDLIKNWNNPNIIINAKKNFFWIYKER